jgi:hypothetical protein
MEEQFVQEIFKPPYTMAQLAKPPKFPETPDMATKSFILLRIEAEISNYFCETQGKVDRPSRPSTIDA